MQQNELLLILLEALIYNILLDSYKNAQFLSYSILQDGFLSLYFFFLICFKFFDGNNSIVPVFLSTTISMYNKGRWLSIIFISEIYIDWFIDLKIAYHIIFLLSYPLT